MVFATLTNYSLTMVFVVKLQLYKCNTHKKTWLLHFYYSKNMVHFRKGSAVTFLLSMQKKKEQRMFKSIFNLFCLKKMKRNNT